MTISMSTLMGLDGFRCGKTINRKISPKNEVTTVEVYRSINAAKRANRASKLPVFEKAPFPRAPNCKILDMTKPQLTDVVE